MKGAQGCYSLKNWFWMVVNRVKSAQEPKDKNIFIAPTILKLEKSLSNQVDGYFLCGEKYLTLPSDNMKKSMGGF